jgi:hypothetical protein
MTIYKIPLTAEPQTFEIAMAGVSYRINLYWNWVSAVWQIDLLDTALVPIVQGMALVGNTNLMSSFAYLGFTGALFATTDADLSAAPTYTNLGSTANVYFASV